MGSAMAAGQAGFDLAPAGRVRFAWNRLIKKSDVRDGGGLEAGPLNR